MKKWLQGIGIGALALGLAACGSAAEPKTDPETGKKVEVTNKSDMTAQEVYSKAMEVSAEQKSMHAVMDIEQNMSIPSEDMNLDSKIKMDMDMIVDPMALHQTMSMDMGEMGATDMELYMTDAGFFMHDAQMDQWIKMPNDMYEEMMASMGGETDPTLDLQMFKDFKDDLKFEQTDDEYILTLNASGDKLNNLVQKLIGDAMPIEGAMTEEEQEVYDNMNVKSLDLTIYIDKKTFYTNAFDMDMDLTMKVEEEEMHMVQKMKSVITKINEIDEIVVPKEVLDEAVSLEDLMGEEG
ncbi:hypothetical protein H9649_04680 [Sporosarcina sp. Sa2YVA2]|uniref:Lipoprotein n=1 Tax=Sporosarcina quadrami TaxID=2762234 RepID=A0ABR8U763_9BACL|nr:DUF6612 family protein [Sporosarcina quadrami]MBD7983868.1 hypothetical protein [Sporosarcina quadrami]